MYRLFLLGLVSTKQNQAKHRTMDTKGSRTAALASIIAANVGKIDEFLSSNGLPPLSLDPDAPLLQPQLKEFTRVRDAALEAISELEALILGPLGILHKASIAVEFNDFFPFSFVPFSLSFFCRWGNVEYRC